MFTAEGKALARAHVALAAGNRQIAGIDCRARVGRGENVVHPVAARTIGNRLVPGLGSKPMKGSVEADDAIARQTKALR